jgi:Insertion element 4 transposase N-terminal/Transposase DDE domain
MRRIFRRNSKIPNRHEIASVVDIPLLSDSLKSVIEEALRDCGKARYRKGTILTPTFVVLVVLGLAIRRDLSYPAVLNWLVSGLRWLTCRLPHKLVAEGALSHARMRLGGEVFRRIFHNMVASQETLPKDFHGLTSVAFDGTTATMPDTKENKQRFGTPKGGRGEGGYPQLRAVALLILPLRLVADFASGAYKGKGTGERNLMNKIIERIPYAHLLYLLDAGLYCFELLSRVQKKDGHHLLAKLSSSVKPKRCSGKNLSDGSYLASVGKKGDTITVRIIPYQIPGFRPARLLTTLLDPAISARELVIHYHRRWDIEIAYDEIKTHQCATLRGRAPTILRSKKPELVEQELYAVLIVYNLVRELIHQAVAGQYEMVRRISFLDSLQCIIDAIPQLNIAGATQAETQLQYLRHLIADCVIDRPQRHRVNPRVVKVKMSKFKRKRKIHKSGHRDLESELQILSPEAA